MSLFSRRSNAAVADAPPEQARAVLVKQLAELHETSATERDRLRAARPAVEAAFNEAKAKHDAALLALRENDFGTQSVNRRESDQGGVLERKLRATAPSNLLAAIADARDALHGSINSDSDGGMTVTGRLTHQACLRTAIDELGALCLLDLTDEELEVRIATIAAAV